jgi:phosphatidyl-myo-inositol dimannoside synthase
LQQADALIADGWAAEHMPDRLGRPVQRVVKGVDADRFTPDGPSPRRSLRLESRRVVLAVARLVPIKNVGLLVDAVAELLARVPQVHLVVVGDGPEAATIRTRVLAAGLRDAVTFVGSVSHAETAAFYRAADVFALSSDFDNSPNVVLEAMASGLPVVATDVGGVREFVAEGVGGAVVPPRDAAALADALERYLTRPELARAAGSYNRARASTEFSWRVSARQLLDVYCRVARCRDERASA